MSLEKSTVGPSELPPLALGSWHIFDRIFFDDAAELVHEAARNGACMFDVGTYDGHSPRGRSLSHTDIIFGQALRRAGLPREDYLLQAKVWLWAFPQRDNKDQVKNTLDRVGVDAFDILSLGPSGGDIDMPRLLDSLAEIIDEGLAGGWGVTGWSARDILEADELAVARGLPRPQLTQLKYGVARRAVGEGRPYAEVFERTQVRLQASDILEGGVLIGRSPERVIGGDNGELRSEIQKNFPRLAYASEKIGVSPAVLAIAFAFTHPHTANVLLGISNLSQLDDAIAGQKLAATRPDEVRAAVEGLQVDGDGRVDPAAWS
ncbi:aldo/keto reductase [Arthrobacter sulfonylureivorans]|uniref:Aldo/keto reductase n=1 Tax=Arthrobacter sulfonylureivorans TaxID=2486855 RepID=A0ABY3W9S9_9MICC|nr:aldo/keto reductase [Arthrobacter sulfonylureivorans]UNK47112.1 aldo/keto reductase [Arthrobacter sulfonylureivorans]